VDDHIRPVSDLAREDYPPVRRQDMETVPQGGAEWGAASLVFGAVFALMIPPCLILASVVGHYGVNRSDEPLAVAAGYLFILLILLLSAAGVAFGILGMNAAQRARRPIALGLAGLMLNALNLLMWAGALLAWHSSW
jgi:hypothetical protein